MNIIVYNAFSTQTCFIYQELSLIYFRSITITSNSITTISINISVSQLLTTTDLVLKLNVVNLPLLYVMPVNTRYQGQYQHQQDSDSQKMLNMSHSDHPLTLLDLRAELLKLDDSFATKLNAVVTQVTEYVDTQLGQIYPRIDKIEEENDRRTEEESWLVIHGISQQDDESPQSLDKTITTILQDIGSTASNIKESTFRVGTTKIIKTRFHSKHETQQVVKLAYRLKKNHPGIFLRESRPQWARDLDWNVRAMAKAQGLSIKKGRIQLPPHNTSNGH